MTARRLAVAAAVALVGAPALALDPPHHASATDQCKDCHVLHRSAGGTLTNQLGNFNVCDQCHGTIVDSDGKHFGFPWVQRHQAIPGAGGRSHRWDADATGGGARVPANPELANRLDAGKLQCSTCHDQHNNGGRPGDAGFKGGAQHVSGDGGAAGTVGVGTAWTPNGPAAGAGTGQMRLVTVTAAAAPREYRVRLSSVGGTSVAFKLSHDRGYSWFAWDGAGWVVDSTGAGAGRTVNLSTTVDLDDGANVRVSFPSAAGYRVGDFWTFWVSYPFLRAPIVENELCEDCHADRVHTATRVEGGDVGYPADGTNSFSHPVGEALARPYDRATVLDANGDPQVASGADADGNPTNNINLGAGGKVRCTSCHAVHNADSNALTQDPR
jgi:predicted CXXCH cytochrome family protein